ncbi:hypothetical protein CRYUN_Cryun34aG0077100 [Craigia yunnanensis]
MSHLSATEVAQTNLLSKKWKDELRPSFPILLFNHVDFIGKNCPSLCPETLRYHPQKFNESIKDFTEFVDATLNHFYEMKLPMQKFKLIIGITSNLESWSCLMDKWIELALEHQVKKLHLHLHIFQKGLYPLPETVFLAKSITVLNLHGFKLDHPHFSNTFSFQSLIKLKLEAVRLDELMIQKLTSDSPLLEVIALKHCWGFAYCLVPKLQRLRTFSISSPSKDLTSIEIRASNLHECNLHCYELVRPLYRISLAECHNLRNLCLSGYNMISDSVFQNLISKLPLLEELRVEFCNILRKVTISSQRLKHLEFTECEELEAISIDTPNLLYFYLMLMGERIPIASINAPACRGEIFFNPLREVDTLWYLKLKKFLGTSNGIERLFIEIEIEIDESLHLVVEKMPEFVYAAMMDAYFSICYPKTLSVRTYSDLNPHRSKFYQWLYETLAKRDVDCCGCSNVKCWRHYLKDIKIESFEGFRVALDGDRLMSEWANLPEGCVQFALEWCFVLEEA